MVIFVPTVYRVPAVTGWPAVRAYYQRRLRGRQAERALPRYLVGAEAHAWRYGGQVFAAALIEEPLAGVVSRYRILVVATGG